MVEIGGIEVEKGRKFDDELKVKEMRAHNMLL